MFDADMKNSVSYHLNKYVNMSPAYINKGSTYKVFKKKLKTEKFIYDSGSDYDAQTKKIIDACKAFVKGVGFSWKFLGSIPEIDELDAYVYGKNKSLEEYLTEVGFDLSEVEEGTFLPRFLGGVFSANRWGATGLPLEIHGNYLDVPYNPGEPPLYEGWATRNVIRWYPDGYEYRDNDHNEDIKMCVFELEK